MMCGFFLSFFFLFFLSSVFFRFCTHVPGKRCGAGGGWHEAALCSGQLDGQGKRPCVQVSWMDRGSGPVFRSAGRTGEAALCSGQAGWTGEAALCSGQLDGQGKRPSAGNSDRMSLLSPCVIPNHYRWRGAPRRVLACAKKCLRN